jgi:hypothetical protein
VASPGLASAATEASYLAPPRPVGAALERDGRLRVIGQAAAHARVEIASADGAHLEASADGRGAWSIRLPVDALRLYAISAMPPGKVVARTVHAEGALLITPGPAPSAVLVRAGYAALPLRTAAEAGLATIDYDPGGVVAAAGFAAPRSDLTLTIDGAPAAAGHADDHGLYALIAANRRLSLGPHQLEVRTPGGAVQREVELEAPVALTAPYRAWRTPDGWRVEWALNGGGVQTTLILDR